MKLWPLQRIVAVSLTALGAKTLVLGVVGTWLVFTIGSAITDYRTASRQTLAITTVAEKLLEAEVSRLRYLRAGAEEDRREALSKFGEIDGAAEDATSLVPEDSPLRARVERLVSGAAAIESAMGRRGALKTEFDRALAAFRERAEAVETQIDQRIGTGLLPELSGDQPSAAATKRLIAEIAGIERAVAELDPAAMEAAVARLVADIGSPDGGSGVAEDLAALAGAAEAIVPLKVELATLDADADAISDEAQQTARGLIAQMAAIEQQLALHMERIFAFGKIAMPLFTVLAVALSGGLAWWASRMVARRMAEALGAIKRIARGEIERPVTGADQPNELGEIISALYTFRENALEAQRAEQASREYEAKQREAEREALARADEEKRKAQARAEQDRQRAGVFAALESAVRDVVEAAANGDFSHRVDLSRVDEEVRDLVGLVNELVRGVDTGLAEIERVAERLGEGDLTRGMAGEFRGTFARLQHNIDRMLDSLGALIGEMDSQAQALSHRSSSLTSGADDLARRAESQAASLEESSAAVAEIAASAESNAGAAREAAADARALASRADEAGGVMKDTIAAMDEIETSSKEIQEIVKVIEEIAFQTNILSLNASVEAARAGEAGRGFAVVADEVRSLAQRTSDASSKVQEIIARSSASVTRGAGSVDRTGDVISAVGAAMTEIVSTLDRIQTASDEQAAAVRDVSSALAQLDQITQKNAAVADETRSGANDVAANAGAMRQAVGAFRYLDEAGRAPAAAVA